MIVSERYRFIFAAIPKTGTHAVRQALREHLGPKDIEQVGLFETKRFPIPELARLGHGHLSLGQVRPFLKPELFDGFLKFAFVRNPFDRFISYCAFRTRDDDEFVRAPQKVMWEFLNDPPMDHLLFQPQHSFLVGQSGKLMTDTLGRVETMQDSYDEIAARIGIPSRTLDKVNDTVRGDYREYYDDALVSAVAKIYARDLELFGYEF
ncbi:MAG: sulfotransferase family 2 domain-containing protein [Sphingomicrobium sp.]